MTPRAGPRPLTPARRSVGMARRSAGTDARTPTASPPGARPAAPRRSGPAPARPPWTPSAGRATTTDGPSSTASAEVLGAGRNLRTMRMAPTRSVGGRFTWLTELRRVVRDHETLRATHEAKVVHPASPLLGM